MYCKKRYIVVQLNRQEVYIMAAKTANVTARIQPNIKEQAEAICNNWKNSNEDVYAYLMDILLKQAYCFN